MTRCIICEKPIDEDRIKAVIGATGKLPETCQAHATDTGPVGYTVYGHKTAGDVVYLINPTAEQRRQMKRAFRRSR